jgi:hypothetical protein
MTKITYLLGAGASADALPTNKAETENLTLPYEMRLLANKLEVWYKQRTENEREQIHNPTQVITDLIWLSDNSKRFETTDTYAKFLYAKKETQGLERLKKTLSFFFVYQQLIEKKIDKRALVFLTNLIEKGPTFPSTVNIISWNYDLQIELAANEILEESCTSGNKHKALLQYFPPLHYGPEKDEPAKYQLVHMNGTAGHLYLSDSKKTNPLISLKGANIPKLLQWHYSENNSNYSILTFAWENDNKDPNEVMASSIRQDSNNIAEVFIKDTEILVIIGYFFPFFNREIDNKLMAILKSSTPIFKKIYFQDKFINSDFIDKQFNILRSAPIKIEHISRCDNYFIPPEL